MTSKKRRIVVSDDESEPEVLFMKEMKVEKSQKDIENIVLCEKCTSTTKSEPKFNKGEFCDPDLLINCIQKGRRPKDSPNIVLARNRVKKSSHFELSAENLKKVFELIDEHFLFGCLGPVLKAEKRKITFRVSNRMTSRAGQVLSDRTTPLRHEIAVSSFLLNQAFSDPTARNITVNGLECSDRLDSLLRIMEHEVIHLLFCCPTFTTSLGILRDGEIIEGHHGPTFQRAVKNLFGHTDSRHDLITPSEIAFETHDISVGCSVRFSIDGEELRGKVNRVQKRVTVLVKDKTKKHPDSVEMSDGNMYRKFYVPISDCSAI